MGFSDPRNMTLKDHINSMNFGLPYKTNESFRKYKTQDCSNAIGNYIEALKVSSITENLQYKPKLSPSI